MEQNSKPKHDVRASSPHHEIILLSVCHVISQKHPLRPEDLRKQRKVFLMSTRSVHNSRATN